MPYIVKLFNPQYWDIEHVYPAETFIDGVAKVLEAIGTSPDRDIHLETQQDGSSRLEVMVQDTTLALVECVSWLPPATGPLATFRAMGEAAGEGATRAQIISILGGRHESS